MSKAQRIKEVLVGLLSIVSAVVMITLPELGYALVALFMCVSLVIYGLQRLGYYFTMARYMVGGKTVLYLGILLFDMGILAGSMNETPQSLIMLYLLAGHLLSGVVSIMRAREQRSFDAPWRLTLAEGIANVMVALACLVFLNSTRMVVLIYSAGLIYSACLRIATAFRRTSIVYIP